MIEIGKYNLLKAVKESPQGFYLADKQGETVLLPNRYVPEDLKIEERLQVFVYLDSEDRPVATTQEPKVHLGEFAWLEVKALTDFGAFMDWGMDKDLLVPFREQAREMKTGRSYVVYLFKDMSTGRLAGSTRIVNFLDKDNVSLEPEQEVDLLVFNRIDAGFQVIVDGLYQGILYHNEIFTQVDIGQRMKGYVKGVREDGKVDVSLQKAGYENIGPHAQKILDLLESGNGFLALTDKSAPEVIYEQAAMSKKNFKKALGALYKQKKVLLKPDGIYLLPSN